MINYLVQCRVFAWRMKDQWFHFPTHSAFFLSLLFKSAYLVHYPDHAVDSNDVGWQLLCELNSTQWMKPGVSLVCVFEFVSVCRILKINKSVFVFSKIFVIQSTPFIFVYTFLVTIYCNFKYSCMLSFVSY